MKYPIGTEFISHLECYTGGIIVEHLNGKYRVQWDDNRGCDIYHDEREFDEIIMYMSLTFKLPYTIGLDEELFEL